jgi:hypothetical protein
MIYSTSLLGNHSPIYVDYDPSTAIPRLQPMIAEVETCRLGEERCRSQKIMPYPHSVHVEIDHLVDRQSD